MSRSTIFRSVYILAVYSLLSFRKALGLVNNVNQRGSKVGVWNNVIDADHLAPLLHTEASRSGLGHRIFSRPTSSKNPIEQALDSILAELQDDSKYVEYWTRQEWRSIHAHADVDEYRAKEEQKTGCEVGEFRYPNNGHVLYLQVGSEVRGPTCVFPNRRSGGDLLRKLETGDENDSESNDEDIELVTVPAVPGRLLRFRGDYLHAVPRPTDLWLLKMVRGSPTFEPEEEWGRSVVLFNTWNEPPLGLPIDEGQEDMEFEEGPHECNKHSKWSQAFTSQDNQCQSPEEHPLSAKIWLLGDYRRRDYQMQTVKVGASESLREALYQESDVTSTMLKIP